MAKQTGLGFCGIVVKEGGVGSADEENWLSSLGVLKENHRFGFCLEGYGGCRRAEHEFDIIVLGGYCRRVDMDFAIPSCCCYQRCPLTIILNSDFDNVFSMISTFLDHPAGGVASDQLARHGSREKVLLPKYCT